MCILCGRHQEAEFAQHAVSLCGGLPLLAQLLETALSPAAAGAGAASGAPSKPAGLNSNPLSAAPRMALLKALAGLIRNVALNMVNNGPLRDHGFIQRLVQVLFRMHQIFSQKVFPTFPNLILTIQ